MGTVTLSSLFFSCLEMPLSNEMPKSQGNVAGKTRKEKKVDLPLVHGKGMACSSFGGKDY